MPSELFVKFEETARIKGARRIIKLVFESPGNLRSAWRKNKVQTAILSDSFGRAEEEHLVFNNRTTNARL